MKDALLLHGLHDSPRNRQGLRVRRFDPFGVVLNDLGFSGLRSKPVTEVYNLVLLGSLQSAPDAFALGPFCDGRNHGPPWLDVARPDSVFNRAGVGHEVLNDGAIIGFTSTPSGSVTPAVHWARLGVWDRLGLDSRDRLQSGREQPFARSHMATRLDSVDELLILANVEVCLHNPPSPY